MTVVVNAQVEGEELRIFVRDPVTAANCMNAKELLLNQVQKHPGPVVVVDLEQSPYIDTTALAVLFDVKKQVTQQGRSFFLQNPSRSVLRMLNLTRMNRIFSIRFAGDAPAAEPPKNDGGAS